MSWATKRAARVAELRARLDAKRPAQAAPLIALGFLAVPGIEAAQPVATAAVPRPRRQRPVPAAHADESSIDARLYRKRPAGFDLGLWLELLSEDT